MAEETVVTELGRKAVEAMGKAYVPYSKFPVGAALLCSDGTIVTGCNVENASYGLTICAERTAIVKAVSEGKRQFTAIAVTTVLEDDPAAPCGACRQYMFEFGTYDVYLFTPDLKSVVKTTTAELLPRGFNIHSLEKAWSQQKKP